VLDELLSGASFSIVSEDNLLLFLLNRGDVYRPLLRWIEVRFLSDARLAFLAEHFVIAPE
jgi:hypothetical protein